MNRINKIPYHLLNSFKYYIKNNEKMTDSDLFDLMEYYPKSYKKGITCYRIIGSNTNNEPIITKKDIAWSKDINYQFTRYLQADDFYHKFEGLVDGFDLRMALNFNSQSKFLYWHEYCVIVLTNQKCYYQLLHKTGDYL